VILLNCHVFLGLMGQAATPPGRRGPRHAGEHQSLHYTTQHYTCEAVGRISRHAKAALTRAVPRCVIVTG
jgi:hypothetical protein